MNIKNNTSHKVALSAILAALALIFSYIEAILPLSVGIPGVKLGLANLVILIALYEMDARYALTINLVRICLSGLLFSGLFAMLYSLAGGLISLAVMWALKRTGLVASCGAGSQPRRFNLAATLISALVVATCIVLFIVMTRS